MWFTISPTNRPYGIRLNLGDVVGPIGHTVVSSTVGVGILAGTGSIEAAATTLGVGVLMDVDHLYDYYQKFARGKPGKIYVLFHGWEYSLVGLVIMSFFFHPPVFIGAVLGHLSHMITDQWHNGSSKRMYFITYRAIKGFNTAAFGSNRTTPSQGHQHPRGKSAEQLIQSAFKWIYRRRLAENAESFPAGCPVLHPGND